ncbi:helix-turn-helix domain-containing protein [Sphingobacterium cellulitidis]|uniref:helix-turn-helix domain-containing protein n=1 Tax=Sphingobacterium cellulitidis TaxID=1768011 RepID=UPI000B93E61B|nr:hypothetical protein CHT99_15465 [Sphingobacterium cellulitidis]
MKPTTKYSLREKALAVEMVVSGYTILETSRLFSASSNTVSKWVSEYFGYRGDDREIITLPSKINDIIESGDIIDYQQNK